MPECARAGTHVGPLSRATCRRRFLLNAAGLLVVVSLSRGASGADLMSLPVAFEADFEDGSLARWQPTDAKAWRIETVEGNKVLSLDRQSAYRPAVRSPCNINWAGGLDVGSFVLDLRAQSTTRDYGHRDLCFFFGRQDPSHFYYAHIAHSADPHAHSVFIVDGGPRLSIAATRNSGIRWGDGWHRIRIVRDVASGLIEVYFDDMATPIMKAVNTRFGSGTIGLGSFDDTGRFDDVRLRASPASSRPSPSGGTGGVQIREVGDVARVEIGGALFTEYRYRDADRPYFYPLIGPTGENLTRHWPMKEAADEQHDHKHHRGLWFTHGNVNGQDFWAEGRGPRIVQDRIVDISSGTEAGRLVTANTWRSKDGRPVCTDIRTHTFYARPDCRMMDVEITARASHGDLVFGDTKEGSMAIRLPATMRVRGKVGKGHILNSEGRRDGATWGTRARWCDYYGPVAGQTVGVAIFDHPSNPRHPTWWHVRTYGLFAANPFGVHDFEKKPKGTGDLKITSGQTVTFRYRFYVHEGGPEGAKIEERYREFAATR